jgi:uncharacterized protein YyaL (SSP411 family)
LKPPSEAPPAPAEASQSVAREPDPALPGLIADTALVGKLAKALANKPAGYAPRTHHKLAGGAPKYTNRLIHETSPYLLQHAHNPVSWYPWGPEAFERARRENKPVLLSVGYSTCHWCHVMERESFEDEEIARFINEHYVAIKVDREERPDIDDVYMKAVQLLAGRGGWPMTTVLTPDRKPFFGGTYFPARDGDRGAPKGFLTILRELHERYVTDPVTVVEEAEALTRRMRASTQRMRPSDVPGPAAIARAAQELAYRYDAQDGGFGRAPKFPRPVTLDFLLRYQRRAKDPQALRMVLHTLDEMATGGLYDHVGGGFHRYSTDAQWLVPHFEKMLYDNGQLVVTYLEAYQASGEERFADVARDVLRYVGREMTAPGGAFYSATDADSPTPSGHDEEGWFFTWTPAELVAVLGEEGARVITAWHGVTPRGNFEGRNILHAPRPWEDVARELARSPAALREAVGEAHGRLYEARKKRPPPLRDDKILAAWNGLMISGFARAAFVLDDDDARRRAEAAALFVLEKLRRKDGRLFRVFNEGRPREQAVLEDYAFVIQGLLDLFEATSSARWLDGAIVLQGHLDTHYADEVNGAWFTTADDAEALLTRDKPSWDGAEPAGGSVATLNLLRLAELTGDERYRRRAERALAAFGGVMERGGTSVPKLLSALDYYLDAPREIVIVHPAQKREAAKALVDVARRAFVPNRVFVIAGEGVDLEEKATRVPLLEGKVARGGKATAYVCERGVCELPTSNPRVLAKQITAVRPLLEDQPER